MAATLAKPRVTETEAPQLRKVVCATLLDRGDAPRRGGDRGARLRIAVRARKSIFRRCRAWTMPNWSALLLPCAKPDFEPVAHIAARRIASAGQLTELLKRLAGEAGMRQLLVIGGDIDASGPYPDALALIQKGRLREAGIEEIGIAAYPEGHAHIPPGRLESALDEKTASAVALGLKVHIVSQFSFSPERVVGLAAATAWLRYRYAGESRYGRSHQRTGAAALCAALRRRRLLARACKRGSDRAGWPYWPGPHDRAAFGCRRR